MRRMMWAGSTYPIKAIGLPIALRVRTTRRRICEQPRNQRPAPAAKRPLTSDDIFRMEAVSEPQISPDGQWIAYLLTTSDQISTVTS